MGGGASRPKEGVGSRRALVWESGVRERGGNRGGAEGEIRLLEHRLTEATLQMSPSGAQRAELTPIPPALAATRKL